MTKLAIVSFICALTITSSVCATDPFAKIVITSTNATCSKIKEANQIKDLFKFEYRDNVNVSFADQSTISSSFLTVLFDTSVPKKTVNPSIKKNKNTSKQALQNFKSITFETNVCLKKGSRKAVANSAKLFPQEQRCLLEGDVRIWQAKTKPTDVPVLIKSEKAELNLTTWQVNFIGSSQNPVSTTIVLEGHPAFAKKTPVITKNNDAKNSPTTT